MYVKTKILNDLSQIVTHSYSTGNKTEVQSSQHRLKLFEEKTSYAGIKSLKNPLTILNSKC